MLIALNKSKTAVFCNIGRGISLTSATLFALGENGSVILSAGNNLTLGTDTLTAKKDMTFWIVLSGFLLARTIVK